MGSSLLFALVAPPLLIMKLLITLSWPTLVAMAGLACLVAGGMLMLNDHNRNVRWLPVPLLLAHVHVFVWTLWGGWVWWVSIVVQLAAIAGFVWICRKSPGGATLLGIFCLFYSGLAAGLPLIGL